MPKKLLAVFAALSFTSSALAATTIVGAGSSFVYPLMSKWGAAYQKVNGVEVNYQAIGSGGGLQQLKSKTIQFAGVDMPQNMATLTKYQWMQFPIISGGIVLAINVPGIKTNQMTLNDQVVSDIFMGKVKKWNNPEIAKLNPKLKLPSLPIYVIHRADGSGTTYNFTDYLSEVSPAWKKNYGFGTAVAWPTGIGAKGNSGVAMFVERTRGAIGYVGYSYAKSNGLAWTDMTNKAGKRVSPNLTTFKAAAKNANWAKAPGFKLLLVNQPGADSWPITASTFILLPKKQQNTAILKFFNWCYGAGKQYTTPLNYVALPKTVTTMIMKSWKHA